MSVHKSLRRVSKNSYIKSVQELSDYVSIKVIALDIDDRITKENLAEIIRLINVIYERCMLASVIDVNVNSDIDLCDRKIRYLNQTKEATLVLSKYLSYMLRVMYKRKIWLQNSKKYTMKYFQTFAVMIADVIDSVDMCIEYINKCKLAKIKDLYDIQLDNSINHQVVKSKQKKQYKTI